ncbi:hypothetical protein Efla_006930 [Eimeria flavescens]
MDPQLGAGAVLLSPLAVEDVFRQKSVQEVQELLRQLQLQQANDAEEVRTLIGIRYLSFLEGLPGISQMHRTAEEALHATEQFGSCLQRLAVALTGQQSSTSQAAAAVQHESPQNQLLDDLPLQHSTPLDDFLYARGTDFLPHSSAHVFHSRLGEGWEGSPDSVAFPSSFNDTEKQGLHLQSSNLRLVQQRLLVLPSRVWEALRRQRFLEALHLVLYEGSHQALRAKEAVQELLQQQKQDLLQPQQRHLRDRQVEACLTLTQQTAVVLPALLSSVRILALRYLASPKLSLPHITEAAAAVTLTFLLESQGLRTNAKADSQEVAVSSAARWLLNVFFSARGEALEVQGSLLGSTAESTVEGVSAGSTAEYEKETAVDAAEGLLVAYSNSIEAAALIFGPSAGDAAAVDSVLGSVGGRKPCAVSPPNEFAPVRAAEAIFSHTASCASAELHWALQALVKVFSVFAAHKSSRSGGSETPGRSCCTDPELCPEQRREAFARQWEGPIEALLRQLLAKGCWESLNDIYSFWTAVSGTRIDNISADFAMRVIGLDLSQQLFCLCPSPNSLQLMNRLEARWPQWHLLAGASLFVVASPGEDAGADCTKVSFAYLPTLKLLRVLGEACVEACVTLCFARVKELPLFTRRTADGDLCESSAASETDEKRCDGGFERDLHLLLTDLNGIVGGSRDCKAFRASASLRATLTATFLRSLAESASHLKEASCTAVAEAPSIQRAQKPLELNENDFCFLIGMSRRVEWLFVACVIILQIDGLEGTKCCQRELSDFFVESMYSNARGDEGTVQQVEADAQLADGNHGASESVCDKAADACSVEAATTAARLFSCDVFASSLLGYAVGFWPMVKKAVEELQASWRWQSAALRGNQPRPHDLEISGGALSLLLELSRCITATARDIRGPGDLRKAVSDDVWHICRRVEELSAAPLMCFALKGVTAEAIALAATSAIVDATGKQGEDERNSAHPSMQIHLLQLLVDIELLAVALHALPPLVEAQSLPASAGGLPLPLRNAVEAGLTGRCSTDALKEVARRGRQGLQPPSEEALQQCLKSGLSTSSSLFLALGDLKALRGEYGSPMASTGGGGVRGTAVSVLNAQQERLPLLPVTPLPEVREDAPSNGSTSNEFTQEAGQQQPKERLKQLHRLRLDDAVDSVSRGLQSWLKRGCSETDGSGLLPSKAGASTSMGANWSAASVSAGSGLAEAWAKQMGQVSALIGQRVESVQSRASQSAALHLGQRKASDPASLSEPS